ncbi:60S ribosomal protein L12 [Gregarina niphandrodes]|uniref:60S ribosomal protein L12 n=1 Tax=Gregarina niphandrodes TaxID=110365 RepID=A0A023B0X1_GRENI|nr:60S ribosomal protein L12 [Gregarina niphandrodes]EZG46116.1 60S ribosomal protein L12 [Gregarina niphandrodes]|eukprot:XP_011132372.1 60S ribosomal protein L12 [Gregarina niphandrodes]
MPPKFDPNAVSYVSLRCYGGEVGPAAVLAPKLGPLGIAPKKAGDAIVKSTQEWKGVKVALRLRIQNRNVTCEVMPTTTAQIIKALNEPVRDRKKVKNIKHSGNLSLDTIIDIARTMRNADHGIPSRTFAGTVLEVLGTANAVGCTVDGKKPTEVQQQIKNQEIDIPTA